MEVTTVTAPTPEVPPRPVLKRFVLNVASLFSVHVANMLLPLLTVPYVVRIIGPERLGLLNFSQAYVAYFTLLINYGFEMAAVRAIAGNRADKALVNRVFSEVMAGKTVLWLVSTVVFACITGYVPEFRAHWVLHVCTYLTCVGVVLFPIWLYQAMEDLGRVALFNLGVKALFSVSVFLFIRKPDDYVYQNLALSLAQVLVSVVALRLAVRRFGVTFTWPTRAQLVQRFREDRSIFMSSLMITLYASSNVFLLGLLSTPYNVGIFSAGTRLESIARSFVGLALNQAFFPIVAGAFGQSREQGLRMVRLTVFPLLALVCAVSLGLWIIAPLFVRLFYGENFTAAIAILRVVALLPVTIGLSNLLGFHTLLNLRMDRAFFVITALGSVLGVGLNAALIPRYGSLGAAWAWVLTEGYITLTMYGYLRYRGVDLLRLEAAREALAFGKNRFAHFFR